MYNERPEYEDPLLAHTVTHTQDNKRALKLLNSTGCCWWGSKQCPHRRRFKLSEVSKLVFIYLFIL